MSKKKPKSLFTVRGKKHERHPQVIVGASRTQFESLSITHSKKHGRVNNIPLDGNPQDGKKDPSYVEKKKAIKDFKFNYTKLYRNFRLTDDDIDKIVDFIQKKRK